MKKINVIITGATGMVGRAALIECLESPDVAKVMVINRQSLGLDHEKLEEVILKDFFDLSKLEAEFSQYDACFFCLGVSSAGMNEGKYHLFTYDLTINFAEKLLESCPTLSFCYVTGAGTDSTEKGKSMWARVKGKTENKLLSMPFKAAYMFRPAYIQPEKGVRSKTALYQMAYNVLKPVYPLLKHIFPGQVTSSSKLGQAMIAVALNGNDRRVLETKDINTI